MQASYDAARTTDENRRHWANADKLSADAVASPQIRCTLRARARYEVANNSYARGVVSTLANYIVGSGPHLQMSTSDDTLNEVVERRFTEWMAAVGLARKLHTMRQSQCESGEVFALLATNPRLASEVQLDVRVIEADQVATPLVLTYDRDARLVDGILFDEFDNPVSYYVLRRHPGSIMPYLGYGLGDYDVLPAGSIIHLFRVDRPGQTRGVPELTSALPLFALLRRYTLAVVSSAEQAALPSGVIYTDAAGEEQVDPMDSVELDRGTWMTMPAGWKIGQVKAEQPTTMYRDFKREVLNEIVRCLNMPFNIAAGNSSDYNYASGRLDHQMFHRFIRVDQARMTELVLDRIFRSWLDEAALIEGFLPQSARLIKTDLSHQWIWDGFEHVDPAKEATAQSTRLIANTTTLAAEFARSGLDWQTELRQRAREVAMMKQLGLSPMPEPRKPEVIDRRDPDEDMDKDMDDEMEDSRARSRT